MLQPTDLTAAGAELARRAMAAILSHECKSADSQNETRGTESRLYPALTDVLRGAGPFHSGRSQAPERAAAAAFQIAALGRVAVQLDFGPEVGRGGEHILFRRPGDHDLRKLTLPDAAGYGFVLDVQNHTLWLRPALASEYLGRLGLMETVFEVPVRVTGIVSNPCGLPQIATAQAWIDGTIPEGSEVSDWLHEQGFLAIARNCQDRGSVPAGSAWYRPADNILMGDAMPRNFIKTPEGLIVPIDVSLTLISMALLPEKALIGGNCRGQVHGSPDPVTGTTYFIDE